MNVYIADVLSVENTISYTLIPSQSYTGVCLKCWVAELKCIITASLITALYWVWHHFVPAGHCSNRHSLRFVQHTCEYIYHLNDVRRILKYSAVFFSLSLKDSNDVWNFLLEFDDNGPCRQSVCILMYSYYVNVLQSFRCQRLSWSRSFMCCIWAWRQSLAQ